MNNKQKTSNDPWFEVLVLRYLSDELDHKSCTELDICLKENEDYRLLFVEICYQSTLFKETLDNRVSELCPENTDRSNWNILSDVIELEEEVTKLKEEKQKLTEVSIYKLNETEKKTEKQKKDTDRQIVIPTVFFYAALLCIVSIIGLSTYFNQQKYNSQNIKSTVVFDEDYVAFIKNTKGCEWDKEYTDGQNLKSGVMTLKKGNAKLVFNDGAEIELVGPAKINLLSNSECTLSIGTLDAYCPTGSEGFIVNVPGGKIVDRGTMFNVSIEKFGENSSSKVMVQNGLIELSTVDKDGKSIKTAELKVDQLVKLSSDSSDVAVYEMQDVEIHGTGHSVKLGERDLYWKATQSSSINGNFKPGKVYVKRYSTNILNDAIRKQIHKFSAQWIGLDSVDKHREADTTYTFQTEFYLDDFDLDEITISGKMMADDMVEAIRINGHSVKTPKQVVYMPHKKLKSFSIDQHFVEGKNKIEFVIKNIGEKNTKNQIGLLVFLKGRGAKRVRY